MANDLLSRFNSLKDEAEFKIRSLIIKRGKELSIPESNNEIKFVIDAFGHICIEVNGLYYSIWNNNYFDHYEMFQIIDKLK